MFVGHFLHDFSAERLQLRRGFVYRNKAKIRLNIATEIANPVMNNPFSYSVDNGSAVSFLLISDLI